MRAKRGLEKTSGREEVLAELEPRIAELLWSGATLIISNVAMSGEGRYPMDFMILTQTKIREP